ncbi:unnamed protein product [Penicillium discolor]
MSTNGDSVIVPSGNPGLANYPHGRLAPATQARTLYVSGTACRRPDDTFAGVKDNGDGTVSFNIREQTLATLHNIEATIKHASGDRSGLESIIDATVFLPNIHAHYVGMNAVWNELYPDAERAPARTVIGVKELPSPKMIVEIKCIAFNVKSLAVPRPTVVKNISDATKRNIVEVICAHVLFVTASFLAGRVICGV